MRSNWEMRKGPFGEPTGESPINPPRLPRGLPSTSLSCAYSGPNELADTLDSLLPLGKHRGSQRVIVWHILAYFESNVDACAKRPGDHAQSVVVKDLLGPRPASAAGVDR